MQLLSELNMAQELNVNRATLRKYRLLGLIKTAHSEGTGRNVRHIYDVEKTKKKWFKSFPQKSV